MVSIHHGAQSQAIGSLPAQGTARQCPAWARPLPGRARGRFHLRWAHPTVLTALACAHPAASLGSGGTPVLLLEPHSLPWPSRPTVDPGGLTLRPWGEGQLGCGVSWADPRGPWRSRCSRAASAASGGHTAPSTAPCPPRGSRRPAPHSRLLPCFPTGRCTHRAGSFDWRPGCCGGPTPFLDARSPRHDKLMTVLSLSPAPSLWTPARQPLCGLPAAPLGPLRPESHHPGPTPSPNCFLSGPQGPAEAPPKVGLVTTHQRPCFLTRGAALAHTLAPLQVFVYLKKQILKKCRSGGVAPSWLSLLSGV